MSLRRGKSPYKACIKCKLVVESSVTVCPNCGSKEFTNNWSGLVIVIDPENSSIAQLLGIKKAGRYAIKIR